MRWKQEEEEGGQLPPPFSPLLRVRGANTPVGGVTLSAAESVTHIHRAHYLGVTIQMKTGGDVINVINHLLHVNTYVTGD